MVSQPALRLSRACTSWRAAGFHQRNLSWVVIGSDLRGSLCLLCEESTAEEWGGKSGNRDQLGAQDWENEGLSHSSGGGDGEEETGLCVVFWK